MRKQAAILTEEDLAKLCDVAIMLNYLQILGVYWRRGTWQFQVGREALVQAAKMTCSRLVIQHESRDGTACVMADVGGIQLVAEFPPGELPAGIERR